MNELNFYKQEKIKYDQLISTTTDEFLKSKIKKEFKDKTKRFLKPAIDKINESFNTNYSVNKESKCLTSTFEKIQSIKIKTKEEINADMDNFNNLKDTLGLEPSKLESIEIAILVIRDYFDEEENIDDNENDLLQDSTSIENNTVIEKPILTNNIQNVIEENIKQNTSDNQIKKEKIVKRKDSPNIIFKLILGFIMIPVICFVLLGSLYFASNAFSNTGAYEYIITSEKLSTHYATIFNILVLLLSGISAGFITAIITGRTNNKMVYTVIPFSIIILFINYIDKFYEILKNTISLDTLPLFLKEISSKEILITFYGFMLFSYLYYIFSKHLKLHITEILNVLVIIYLGIIPGIMYILNAFNINNLNKLKDIMYNYNQYEIVLIILISLTIISNIIFNTIKNIKSLKEA